MRVQSLQFIHKSDGREVEMKRYGGTVTIRESLDDEAQCVTLSLNEFEALHSLIHDVALSET